MTPKRDWLYVSTGSGPSILAIEDAVIAETLVARRELHSDYCDRRITEARAIIYYLAHDYGGHSWGKIGQHLDRDHSTAVKQAQRARSSPSLAPVIERIKMHLGVYGGATVRAPGVGRPEMYGLAVKAVKAELGIMA